MYYVSESNGSKCVVCQINSFALILPSAYSSPCITHISDLQDFEMQFAAIDNVQFTHDRGIS